MSWTAFLLPSLITLVRPLTIPSLHGISIHAPQVLAAMEPDNEEPGINDKAESAKMETLAGPFQTMAIVNFCLAVSTVPLVSHYVIYNGSIQLVFALVSCIFYTKYRSKGSDDKKKMRR